MKSVHIVFAGFMLLLAGCSGPAAKDYAGKTPVLDVREFMHGDLEAWGVFYKRNGMADPSFKVSLHGDFSETDGTLKENFIYSDGKKQQREWRLHFTDDHHFTGTAADVIGVATGEQYGNAVRMQYTLRITSDSGSSHDLCMDDWLYMTDDTHLMNHNEMSKLGFKVGELLIGFRKLN